MFSLSSFFKFYNTYVILKFLNEINKLQLNPYKCYNTAIKGTNYGLVLWLSFGNTLNRFVHLVSNQSTVRCARRSLY